MNLIGRASVNVKNYPGLKVRVKPNQPTPKSLVGNKKKSSK